MDDNTIERFESKFVPEPNSGCWLWVGARSGGRHGGYGYMNVGGQMLSAHRLSWNIHYGEVPDRLFVLHRCDTPSCVNPAHLFVGTHSENMSDMVKKGRSQRVTGALCSGAKLTRDDVVKIRLMYAAGGRSYSSLAKEFSVDPSTARDIVVGETWSHI